MNAVSRLVRRSPLVPRLLAGRSAVGASLILGMIWAVWHLPVVLSDPVMRVPAPFMITVVLTSVLYAAGAPAPCADRMSARVGWAIPLSGAR